jgi:hypothetical protein
VTFEDHNSKGHFPQFRCIVNDLVIKSIQQGQESGYVQVPGFLRKQTTDLAAGHGLTNTDERRANIFAKVRKELNAIAGEQTFFLGQLLILPILGVLYRLRTDSSATSLHDIT